MTGTAAVYWLTQSHADVPVEGAGDWLTAGEQAKLGELHYLKRRADWRLGRWTAKRAVCLFLRRDGRVYEPRGVEVVAGQTGAPEIRLDGRVSDVCVSISHSGGTGFCVVSSGGFPVGCDVETIGPRSERFVADYFTSREAEVVRNASDSDRPNLTTLIWSAKESALKAMRVGLDRDTRSVQTAVGTAARSSSWRRLQVRCLDTDNVFFGWCRRDGDRVFTCMAAAETDTPISLVEQSGNSA
jgi:4'-phosphopantetheinyl transferase